MRAVERREIWAAGPRLAVLLLLIVVALGTAGYIVIEGWHPWDAFYMTVTTVATVGYREVHELSWPGQVFTVGLIVCGVSTVLYTFTALMTLLVEGAVHRRFQERRLHNMLDELSGHYIVCGYGRIGSIIADEFRRQRVPFVIIERDTARLQAALEAGHVAVEADASDEEVLKRVRIDRARGFIAAVGSDAENVYAVLTARLLKPDLFIAPRRRMPAASSAGQAPTASSLLIRSAASSLRRRPSGPPSSTSSSSPRAPTTWNCRWSR